jgi:hypothetical protein
MATMPCNYGFPAKINRRIVLNIGFTICLSLISCPRSVSGFRIPNLHSIPQYKNPFSQQKTLNINSRTSHRLHTSALCLLSIRSVLWTEPSSVFPWIILREVIAYTCIFLYNSWLVSLYSGHARWRLPPNPSPLVGASHTNTTYHTY